MRFMWRKFSKNGKYHLDDDFSETPLCGFANDYNFIRSYRHVYDTKLSRPLIEECCKNCLKIIEGFRNLHHPVHEPPFRAGVIEGRMEVIKAVYGNIVKPGEEIIAYGYCMHEKRIMPIVKRKIGEVCAGCNASWR